MITPAKRDTGIHLRKKIDYYIYQITTPIKKDELLHHQ